MDVPDDEKAASAGGFFALPPAFSALPAGPRACYDQFNTPPFYEAVFRHDIVRQSYLMGEK
ncbi:hypothetical protein A6M21_01035 [Desulfotomaculum copahuensis]|uniref:Uncharacterized protein n=1 Tax=Desulfotomaculum copahuensis TaxID=1838280 RepID=A0A1B7LC15_9FIRM|nr:hypothetical protein A6M21_01035 [Desulfotomaculum copahuensis]